MSDMICFANLPGRFFAVAAIILMTSFLYGCQPSKVFKADVLVVGGGTGGTAAGIQSARSGAKTVIVEPGVWLGGMISSAGVSAIDGNHALASGLWNEFREKIYKVYGGPAKVETGWVSKTQFEPHVADSIFKQMVAAEKNLTVLYENSFERLTMDGTKIAAVYFKNKKNRTLTIVKAPIVIDATELGDVLKAAGVPFDIGMEAGSETGESVGVNETNDIIQDLTYVAILKDFGKDADKTIPRPTEYNPKEFDGSNTDYYHDKTIKAPTVNAKKMLEYGKLPKSKYMINWPIRGNDTYLNVIEMTGEEREFALQAARQTTMRFIYFIQHELGYKNLGLADDEFPTKDKLAIIPYYREGRRAKGLVRFTMPYIERPFDYKEPLYRTGISVGDYPIDHHHKKNLSAPQHLEFHPIPSFNVPLGAIIPKNVSNLIVAEKGISVSNVVNGTTRLQPCVLLTGQAAGILAAMSSTGKIAPRDVGIRALQQQLLTASAYIMPYIDVPRAHPLFESIQRIGATGILRGTGIPYKWANQTWFYPDSSVVTKEFVENLQDMYSFKYSSSRQYLTIEEAIDVLRLLNYPVEGIREKWFSWGLENFDTKRMIKRSELAVLLDKTLDPFKKEIDYNGYFKNKF